MRYRKVGDVKDMRFCNDSLCLLLYLIIYNKISQDSYSPVIKVTAVADITVNLK